MNQYPPKILVETWLFLAKGRTESQESQIRAKHRIIEVFGSEEFAEIYLERLNQPKKKLA